MPANPASLEITDDYRARLLRLRDRVVRMVLTSWTTTVDIERLEASFRVWARAAEETISAGQAAAAMASGTYLAEFVASELDEHPTPLDLDPGDYAGQANDGRPLGALLGSVLVGARLAERKGLDVSQVRVAGAARAVRLARTEVMEASRRALADGMNRHQRVKGYRRVTSGSGSCGACLGSATRTIYPTRARLRIHWSCRCTAEPVVSGVSERVKRPTGEELFRAMSASEQARMFAGKGGEAKAALIRSGEVSLADLVVVERNAIMEDTITEAPLKVLK